MTIAKLPALFLLAFFCCAPALAASDPEALAKALDVVNHRLDQLEQQNRQLSEKVDELTRQNQTLRANAAPSAAAPVASAASAAPAVASSVASASATPAAAPREEWESRIRLGGDFRFRQEEISNGSSPDRPRESIRARLSASIKINDDIKGEVGIGSGGRDPRGGAAVLGEASARKEIGLDLAYMSWRATDEFTLTAGKMREPYLRPGRSLFIDNEIRPEGLAVNYRDKLGLFGSAFNFWLEERSSAPDSMLRGGQFGWDGAIGKTALKAGLGYYDYHNVQGRNPNFGNGVVNQFGNTIIGTGSAAVYAYDYDIGQLFAEITLPVAGVPLNFYGDYGHNFDADNGLDTAYSFGFLVGKANAPGRWEAGVLNQKVEKDALFGQWIDSDYGSGVTDNNGYLWRVAWMAVKNLVIDGTYFDTSYNVDVGTETNYDRWQLNFNFSF
jgi:hypothetical protein